MTMRTATRMMTTVARRSQGSSMRMVCGCTQFFFFFSKVTQQHTRCPQHEQTLCSEVLTGLSRCLNSLLIYKATAVKYKTNRVEKAKNKRTFKTRFSTPFIQYCEPTKTEEADSAEKVCRKKGNGDYFTKKPHNTGCLRACRKNALLDRAAVQTLQKDNQ